jgi:mycothiol synthase
MTTITLRAPTMNDLTAVAEMISASYKVDEGYGFVTIDEMRDEWTTPGFVLERDSRIIESPDGKIAGYIYVLDNQTHHVRPTVWGRVHPDHREKGIGTCLLRWAEERARQCMDQAPPNARITLGLWIDSLNEAAQMLFRNEGYLLTRHFWRMAIIMDEPPSRPIWPAGITLRTAIAGQDERAIFDLIEEATKDHWGYLPGRFETWLHYYHSNQVFDPSLWFLAIDSDRGDQIAGVCLCRPSLPDEPDMGWVDELAVLRPFRRRGIALAMLQHAFAEFYRRNVHKVGLGVDAASLTGATRLYEKAGMFVTREYRRYEKELRSGVELSTQEVCE